MKTTAPMKWKIKAIQQENNLGTQLKKARASKGLTIYRIANNYCIPKTFLEAVESNNYETLPNTVYTKGMLKKYLRILELPTKEGIEEWEEGHAHWEALSNKSVTEKDIKQEKTSFKKSIINPVFIQKGFAVTVSLFLLVYIGVKVDAAIAPTDLQIIAPHDQMTTTESSITVKGVTEAEVEVSINQFPVTVDENGIFEEVITLQDGLNVLEIAATKKYRPTQTIKRHILLTNNN